MTYSVHIDHEEQNSEGAYSIYVYHIYSHVNTNNIF